jgi:hypothetical protein
MNLILFSLSLSKSMYVVLLINYHCLARSKFVIETILEQFGRCALYRLRVFQQLTEPLLKMNDSLMKRRIHWLLNPFHPTTVPLHLHQHITRSDSISFQHIYSIYYNTYFYVQSIYIHLSHIF